MITGTTTSAASRLSDTPPAISRLITSLEEDLELKLFNRHKGRCPFLQCSGTKFSRIGTPGADSRKNSSAISLCGSGANLGVSGHRQHQIGTAHYLRKSGSFLSIQVNKNSNCGKKKKRLKHTAEQFEPFRQYVLTPENCDKLSDRNDNP